METDFHKKTQEIVYVLMRVGATMRRVNFRSRLEYLSLDLLQHIFDRNFEHVLSTSASLEALVQLGVSLYEVETVNAQFILHELAALQSAIRQKYGSDELPNIRQSDVDRQDDIAEYPATQNAVKNNDSSSESVQESASDSGMVSIVSTIRQSAILNKVREMTTRDAANSLSGCRMKDLTAAFPDVSERTLRYDLQHLLNRDVIERLGSSGPSAFYVIK